jgi:hypothetical protein
VTPRTADAIRKVLAYALATVLTVLLFRVLSRLANGRQALLDPELLATLVLAALGTWWVSAARRVRRERPAGEAPDEGPRQ